MISVCSLEKAVKAQSTRTCAIMRRCLEEVSKPVHILAHNQMDYTNNSLGKRGLWRSLPLMHIFDIEPSRIE